MTENVTNTPGKYVIIIIKTLSADFKMNITVLKEKTRMRCESVFIVSGIPSWSVTLRSVNRGLVPFIDSTS